MKREELIKVRVEYIERKRRERGIRVEGKRSVNEKGSYCRGKQEERGEGGR